MTTFLIPLCFFLLKFIIPRVKLIFKLDFNEIFSFLLFSALTSLERVHNEVLDYGEIINKFKREIVSKSKEINSLKFVHEETKERGTHAVIKKKLRINKLIKTIHA